MASDSEKTAVKLGTHDFSSVNASISNVDPSGQIKSTNKDSPIGTTSGDNPTTSKHSDDITQLESKLNGVSLQEGTPVAINTTTTRYPLRSRQQASNPWRDSNQTSNKQPLLPRPQPAAEYLKQACKASTKSTVTRALLIIADLNGCLLDRGKKRSGIGHHRPYLKELLEYCLNNHHIMVWSSATPANVRSMSDHVFAGLQKQPIAIWDRSSLQLTNAQSKENVQVYKQLHWVWDDKEISRFHPNASSGGSWDQTNTILIDDSIEKAAAQPHNQLVVPDYKKEMAEQEMETTKVLLKVIEYLKEAAYYEDVSSFIYNLPFQKWMETGSVAGEIPTTE